MKVYKSYSPNLRDSKEVPQIKIKNDMLSNSGFEIGKEFAVIYQPKKITLILVEKTENNNQFRSQMSLNLINNIIQPKKLRVYLPGVGTKSVQSKYIIRQTFEKSENKKASKQSVSRLFKSWRTDLNRRPADYKSAALPTELRQLINV